MPFAKGQINTGRPRLIRPAVLVIGPSIAYVPLSRGLHALIDSDDAELVSKQAWHAHFDVKGNYFYAIANISKDGKRSLISLHRYLFSTNAKYVDHRNRNTLDDRRCNLRDATASQNQSNRKTNHNSSTGFKNVYFQKSTGNYRAQLMHDGKTIYAGCSHSSPEEAYRAALAKAVELKGEFAR